MGKYSLEFNRAAAAATAAMGLVQATATTPRRLKLFDLIIGSEAAPADNVNLWTLDRVSGGSPTGGTSVTPQPLDPADAVALCDAVEGTITVNPTIGTRLLSVPLNQRATFRWVAAPGSELVSPATDNHGFAVQTPTAVGLIAVTATLLIEEQ